MNSMLKSGQPGIQSTNKSSHQYNSYHENKGSHEHFPWVLIDSKGRLYAKGGAIDRLLKTGILMLKGNYVGFALQHASVMAVMRQMAQTPNAVDKTRQCLLLRSHTHLPVITIVTPLPHAKMLAEGFNPGLGLFLLTFIAENCCVMDVSALTSLFSLTLTESRILALVCEGYTIESIAEVLGCKVGGVRFHIKNIFQKTGARKQSELVSFAFSLILALGMNAEPRVMREQPVTL